MPTLLFWLICVCAMQRISLKTGQIFAKGLLINIQRSFRCSNTERIGTNAFEWMDRGMTLNHEILFQSILFTQFSTMNCAFADCYLFNGIKGTRQGLTIDRVTHNQKEFRKGNLSASSEL